MLSLVAACRVRRVSTHWHPRPRRTQQSSGEDQEGAVPCEAGSRRHRPAASGTPPSRGSEARSGRMSYTGFIVLGLSQELPWPSTVATSAEARAYGWLLGLVSMRKTESSLIHDQLDHGTEPVVFNVGSWPPYGVVTPKLIPGGSHRHSDTPFFVNMQNRKNILNVKTMVGLYS